MGAFDFIVGGGSGISITNPWFRPTILRFHVSEMDLQRDTPTSGICVTNGIVSVFGPAQKTSAT
jgi:hypothetical protein